MANCRKALATTFEKAELLHSACFVPGQLACDLAAVPAGLFGFEPGGAAETDAGFVRYRSPVRLGKR